MDFVKEPILPARHFRAMKPPSELIPTEDAPNAGSDGPLQAQHDRRLSDRIAKAFYQACWQKNALAANYLLRAFEAVHSFEADLGIENRRVVVDLISEMRRELLAATSPVELPVTQPERPRSKEHRSS